MSPTIIKCASCGHNFEVWIDRRVICLNCGFDGGRILVGPIRLLVPDDYDDLDCQFHYLDFLVRDAILEV